MDHETNDKNADQYWAENSQSICFDGQSQGIIYTLKS